MFYPGPIRTGPPEGLMILYWLFLAFLVVGGGVAFYCADLAAGQGSPRTSVEDANTLGLIFWVAAAVLEVVRRVVRRLIY